MKQFQGQLEFEWDHGNQDKNFLKHGVRNQECEEAFFDQKKKILRDTLHSGKEIRYVLLGKTQNWRVLFVIFTIRRTKIRIISARDLNKKELYLYEK